jgi:deazaflavin-dependent oxidoreductase (nitroreductase family)
VARRRRLPAWTYRLIGIVGRSRFVTRSHPVIYRLTGGRGPVGHVLGVQMVVLTTTGRRSGQPRDAPLFALGDGSTFLLVGTHGGEETLPDWVANLRVTREATLQVGRQRMAVSSREPQTGGEEYRTLWARAVAAYPGYAEYRARRSTDPPIVVFEPR